VDGVRGGPRSEAKCTLIGSLEDCGPTVGRCPRKRSRGRSGRNRDGTDGVHEVDGVRGDLRSEAECTFSPSFGGSAGHHDSPT